MTMPALIERKTAKWIPKKWEIWMDQAVMLATLGKSNKELALMFSVTPQHISNLLTTPQAALIRRKLHDSLQDKVEKSIPNRIDAIVDKSIQRVHALIHDDELYAQSPFAVVDRALSVIKGAGHIHEQKGVNIEKAIILNVAQSADLLEGLNKADRAREIHKDTFIETSAKDVTQGEDA